MYPLRSILVLLLFFFGLHFIGEFIVGPLMGDDIPTWKIAAVSLISALSAAIPMQKRGLKPGDILKYFKRSYFVPELELSSIFPAVAAQFPSPKFKLKLDESKNQLVIIRKANMRSFGEVLSLRRKGAELVVRVRPKFYIDVFDQGQAYESLLRMEQIIQGHEK